MKKTKATRTIKYQLRQQTKQYMKIHNRKRQQKHHLNTYSLNAFTAVTVILIIEHQTLLDA